MSLFKFVALVCVIFLIISCSDRAAVVSDSGVNPDFDVSVDGQNNFDSIVMDSNCAIASEQFKQKLNRKVDVLFVIDSGGSMMDERDRILALAPVFTKAASNNSLDFHLGVTGISTILNTNAPLGALYGYPHYIKSTDKDLDVIIKEKLDLPSTDPTNERGLDAIIAALSPELSKLVKSGACNACPLDTICVNGNCYAPNYGFRRDDASLEILVFTDEEDGSSVSASNAVSKLKSQVDPSLGAFVRLHALLPLCISHTNFPKWKKVINDTGGEVNDLCAKDYSPAITKLTSRIFGLQDQFYLSQKPINPSAITVSVDFFQVTNFTYDEKSNSIIFKNAPADKSVINIDYSVDCDGMKKTMN